MIRRGAKNSSTTFFAVSIILIGINHLSFETSVLPIVGVMAFEVCGSGDDSFSWTSKQNNRTNDDNGFYCPSKNTCCQMVVNEKCNDEDTIAGEKACSHESWGCIASDMGSRNATCCSDDSDGNTGCPTGYECRRNQDESSTSIRYDCVWSKTNQSSKASDSGDKFMKVLPRYQLCRAEESNRKLYGLDVPVPSLSRLNPHENHVYERDDGHILRSSEKKLSKLAYYSNLGAIECDHSDQTRDIHCTNSDHRVLSEVEMALIVIHGANRNGDDYFCSAKATVRMQDRFPSSMKNTQPSVLVIAPSFLETPYSPESAHEEILNEHNPSSFLYWNDTDDKDGSWRYGADATGPSAVSSFDAMDAIITSLKSSERFPKLHRVVVLGHSSGGQFVQRWSLLTSAEVWPAFPNRIQIHAIVANPSSYAYLTPLRFFENDIKISYTTSSSSSASRSLRTDSNGSSNSKLKSRNSFWKIPSTNDCPNYNQWEWGLDDGGQMDVPYRKRAFSREGHSKIVDRYLQHRSVIYLIGNLDRCNEGETKQQYQNPSEEHCNSHGLETTCADELQGTNRYERNARYWASLELVVTTKSTDQALDENDLPTRPKLEDEQKTGASLFLPRHKHHRVVVPNAGHDHSMMFQSKEGIDTIYNYEKNS